MNGLTALFWLFPVVVIVTGVAPPEQCKQSWKKVGCFHDRVFPNRPLTMELVNHRDPINPNWDGHLLDWHQFPQSLHALACKCAELTKKKGYKYFGLQFYGECWSGPSPMFYRDGPSKRCIGNDYKPCEKNSDSECVGKAFTNYIYHLSTEQHAEEQVPGGWDTWSKWTECSKKCNGGTRSRERICNNPKPENGGEECEGEPEESIGCNEDACEPVCDKRLEVGVILDGSTSVTSRNWKKTLDFLDAFSDEFVVGPDRVHFGVIHFAWRAYLDFKISDKRYWSPFTFKKAVSKIRYIYGGTRTDLALKKAEKEFFCKDCGVRPGVPQLLIVLTDGKSSFESKSLKEVTEELKNKRVTIISIGVGHKVDENELTDIATDEEHTFLLDDYNYLKDKVNQILKVSCRTRNE